MVTPLHILIVEDSEDDTLLLLRELRHGGFDPVHERVDTPQSMRMALEQRQWDLVISDYVLPKFGGLAALKILLESGLDLPFIVVSGNIGEDIAVEAMKAGAHDYIIKGNPARLVPAVERELREAEVRRERKRAEKELTRLAAAVEAAADAIVITEPARGAILYVNPAFEKITGYAREEAVGRNLHMLDSGSHDDTFYRDLRETLNRDGVWSGRLVNKKKDGTLYQEDCTYAPVKSESGEIINFISIKRDVTEKVRLESIAQTISTMNSIGYIFSGVRHEIGNPVNTIGMTLGILTEKLETMDLLTLRKHVDRMTAEISKIDYLLQGLKTFNMFERPEPQTVEMADFMNKFMALAQEDFAKKEIRIESTVDRKAVSVYADPRALQQVLLNVFTNAADALNGRKDPKISVRATKEAGMVRIRVEDNGCGIAVDRLSDVLKPFYTTKTHGTGLGLMIIKKLLAGMNGTMEIASREGIGTCVDVFIPAGKNDKKTKRKNSNHES